MIQAPRIDAKNPEKDEATLTKDNTVVWDCVVPGLDKKEILLKYVIEHPASEDIDFKTV